MTRMFQPLPLSPYIINARPRLSWPELRSEFRVTTLYLHILFLVNQYQMIRGYVVLGGACQGAVLAKSFEQSDVRCSIANVGSTACSCGNFIWNSTASGSLWAASATEYLAKNLDIPSKYFFTDSGNN